MPFIGGLAAGGLVAGGNILSGILGSDAASKASSQESSALQQGINFQQGVFNTTQQNLSPFINSGNTALSSLMGLLGLGGSGQNATAQSAFNGFAQTPSYQFPLQQGNLALNRQLASAGLSGSGAALKDAVQYNQGYASQGLGSYLSQLGGVSQLGQQSAVQLGSQGNQASSLLGNLFNQQGQAQAAGTIGSTNAITGALGQGIAGLVGNNANIGGQSSTLGSLVSGLGSAFGTSSFGSPGQTALINQVNAQPS
jgi:hypothetical protein